MDVDIEDPWLTLPDGVPCRTPIIKFAESFALPMACFLLEVNHGKDPSHLPGEMLQVKAARLTFLLEEARRQ